MTRHSTVRLDLLARAPFLAALALLVANDWLLKPAFHNALTGKLSDFAGVFALAVFLAAFAPHRARACALLTGIAFALWKSPWSQPLIDAWNAAGALPIGRVVDPTDLVALAMLPLAVRYVERAPRRTPRTALGWITASVAVVAFTATSMAPRVTPYDEHYAFELGREELEALITHVFRRDFPAGGSALYAFDLRGEECGRYAEATGRIAGNSLRSRLYLLEVEHFCEDTEEVFDAFADGFERDVVAPLRRAQANDSLMAVVREHGAALRAARLATPLTVPQLSKLLRLHVAPQGSRVGETIMVSIVNDADVATYDVCAVQLEVWRDPEWVRLGPASTACAGAEQMRRLEAGMRTTFLLNTEPPRWTTGAYRLSQSFTVGAQTVVVTSNPFYLEPMTEY